MSIKFFFILPIVLIAGNLHASSLCNDKQEKSARIYYTSTSLVTRLFQTLDALVTAYPERDEHVSQYLCMLQKEVERRMHNKTLSSQMLVHMMERFENWLGHYGKTPAGEKNKLLLADIIHITDRTMCVIRQQMVREKKLSSYQLQVLEGIELVYKTIDSLKASIRMYPYKDEHLSACLRRLEEEVRAKVAERSLTVLALVQMIESFHKWLLYYVSTTHGRNARELVQTCIHQWTQMCRYVINHVGDDQSGTYESPSPHYYRIAMIPLLACAAFWLGRSFFEKKNFIKSFFSTMNLEQELDNQRKKHDELVKKAENVAAELSPYQVLLKTGDGVEKRQLTRIMSVEEMIAKVEAFKNHVSLISVELGAVNSLQQQLQVLENELKKLEGISLGMKEELAKIEATVTSINLSNQNLSNQFNKNEIIPEDEHEDMDDSKNGTSRRSSVDTHEGDPDIEEDINIKAVQWEEHQNESSI